MALQLERLRAVARRAKNRFKPRHLRRRDVRAIRLDIARLPYMGFGATVAWLHMAHVAADALGASLQVVNPGRWPFGGRLAACPLDRFVQLPLDERAGPVTEFDPGSKSNLAEWGYHDDLAWSGCLFGFKPRTYASLETYRRHVLARAYLPTPESQAAIASRLGFLPPRYLAWHVRRGDKTAGPAKEDDPVPLERYADATEAIMRTAAERPTTLVVCTDSPDVIEESRRLAPALDLQFAIDEQERRWDGYCAVHRTGAIQDADTMIAEVWTAQKVIEILRRAEHLVGCNSSYLYRVGAMLQSRQQALSLSENKTFRPYFPL